MSNPFREIYLEALKGNQHKIDVDKDGKVEGEDLAKLRAKKMKEEIVSEKAKEMEDEDEKEDDDEDEDEKEDKKEIDELNKSTLASYAGKAAASAAQKTGEAEKRTAASKESEKRAKDPKLAFAKSANQQLQKHDAAKAALAKAVAAKRLAGVNRAVTKMAKEEVEQIDELTDDQIKKLRADAADSAKKSIDKQSDDRIAKLKSDKEDSKKSFLQKVGDKQIAMVKGAVKGLMKKEDVDQIDELSKSTLASYAKKATKDARIQQSIGKDFEASANKSRKPSMKDAAQSLADKYKSKSRSREAGIGKAVDRLAKEELELQEANHREFASKGMMHPDMAKHMSVGQEHDYYEHGTGDKVSGKVVKKTSTEVHMKQTHDSYDPKKKGTVHKFKIGSTLPEETSMEYTQEELALIEQFIEIAEKMNMSKASMGDVIKDFKKSDAPQFKGKTVEKRREMAIAAKLSADREAKKEEVELVSFKGFNLDEIKMSDLPVRKVTGRGYGTEYYKGEKEKDKKGYDADDEKETSSEKRGRGRPKGSASGARQKGSTPKKKGSGVEMTGYPLHLPNR